MIMLIIFAIYLGNPLKNSIDEKVFPIGAYDKKKDSSFTLLARIFIHTPTRRTVKYRLSQTNIPRRDLDEFIFINIL